MKINIRNLTLTCKKQHLICDNCLFGGKIISCVRELSVLNKLCTTLDSVFVQHSSSDLFDL